MTSREKALRTNRRTYVRTRLLRSQRLALINADYFFYILPLFLVNIFLQVTRSHLIWGFPWFYLNGFGFSPGHQVTFNLGFPVIIVDWNSRLCCFLGNERKDFQTKLMLNLKFKTPKVYKTKCDKWVAETKCKQHSI